MKCDHIQQQIADLFDDQASGPDREKLLSHISICDDCAAAYADYISLGTALKPERETTAATNQAQAILDAINMKSSPAEKSASGEVFWKRSMRIAASALLFTAIGAGIIYMITYRKSAYAAGEILDKSIRSMTGLKSVSMVFSLRANANENFESIDPRAGFLDFRVFRIFGEKTKWRFERPGRTIIMDGQDQFLISENGGYVLKGGPKAGFAGWMKVFLEPMKVLETERSFARDHHSSYTISEKGDRVEVSVKTAALGKFDNPYALNSSIPEANTHRRYVFDRETNMLISVSVFIVEAEEEICVLKLTSVRSNPSLPDSLFVFRNPNNRPVLTLEAYEQATANGVKDINSAEAARLFFTACADNDWNTVSRFSPLFSIPGGKALKVVRDKFGGARLLHAGRPFTSGLYAGEYVPYAMITKGGDTVSGNLALRNDNPPQVWIIDGGY
jgi:outer membrane lipoprotein-sorting protein